MELEDNHSTSSFRTVSSVTTSANVSPHRLCQTKKRAITPTTHNVDNNYMDEDNDTSSLLSYNTALSTLPQGSIHSILTKGFTPPKINYYSFDVSLKKFHVTSCDKR